MVLSRPEIKFVKSVKYLLTLTNGLNPQKVPQKIYNAKQKKMKIRLSIRVRNFAASMNPKIFFLNLISPPKSTLKKQSKISKFAYNYNYSFQSIEISPLRFYKKICKTIIFF
jgi:hypothetical protein